MADTFTRFLDPGIGEAALRVLGACGADVRVVDPGLLRAPAAVAGPGGARPVAAPAARSDRLAPHALAGHPIVVLEPSCWSMLVDDLPRLVPGDPRARWVADAAVTFERAVADLGAPPLRDDPLEVVVHEHCHAAALGGGREGAAALARIAGLASRGSGAGCCGMAGPSATATPSCRGASRTTGSCRPCATRAWRWRRAPRAASRSGAPPAAPRCTRPS